MMPWRHVRNGGMWLVAAAALIGAPVDATAPEAPPIDPAELETLAPAAGTELDDEAAEQLLTMLEGIESNDDGSSSMIGPCGGVAFSYDSDGELIDSAYDAGSEAPPIDLIDGGQAFTAGNRFKVDTDGTVSYYGFAPRAGDGPMDYSYNLKVAAVTAASGAEENSSGDNRNGGTIDFASELPFPFDANVDTTGTLTIDGLEYCGGEGKVEFVGNGFASVPGLVGVGLLGIGVLGVFINARPARTWKV